MDIEQTIYPVLISFIICMILCPFAIPYLHRLKFGQYVRDDGPQSHIKKSGTPTMGGIIILISFIITSFFFIKGNPDGLVVAVMTLAFGIIGFLDDYIKVVKKRSLGLRAFQKLVLQLLAALLFAYYLLYVKQVGTGVIIPFSNGRVLELGYLYIPFLLIVLLGTVNGVNLTDGLDGLASGVTLLIAVYLCLIAGAVSNGTTPVSGAIIGSLLGFLLYNTHPARVFMGDTGSLALGGYVASCAFLLRLPVFIAIIGIIYLLESISVMIQVGYFKKTGKRVFKMAPYHHHLELSGWPETRIVTLFYIITAVACMIGFIASRGVS